jgi:hypothetical protein
MTIFKFFYIIGIHDSWRKKRRCFKRMKIVHLPQM